MVAIFTVPGTTIHLFRRETRFTITDTIEPSWHDSRAWADSQRTLIHQAEQILVQQRFRK